jgi:hypothetical protein
MNVPFLAASGHGKSYAAQCVTELNLDDYDHVIALDREDEFRGLCSKQHGPAPCKHWMAGKRELEKFGPEAWARLIEQNGHVVIARLKSDIDAEDWREIAADVVTAGRNRVSGSCLFVVDEAHFVAPQQGSYPDSIKGLATTGRGEGNSAMWITQRPAEIDKTVLANSTARFVGGFTNKNDLTPFEDIVEYPADVHVVGGRKVPGLPEELHADDAGAVSVRKWTEQTDEGDERVTDSEWIYSDDTGKHRRLRSAEAWSPACDHVGASGKTINFGL